MASSSFAQRIPSENSCLDAKFPTAANREFLAAISDHIHLTTDCCELSRVGIGGLKKETYIRVAIIATPSTSPSDTYRRGQVEWALWRMSTIGRPTPEEASRARCLGRASAVDLQQPLDAVAEDAGSKELPRAD
jgi:hypothetical protein